MDMFEGVDRNRNIIIAVAVVVVILVIIYLYTAGHLSGIVCGDTFTRASEEAASVGGLAVFVIMSRGLEFATIPVAKTFSWCSPSGSSCVTSIRALWTH